MQYPSSDLENRRLMFALPGPALSRMVVDREVLMALTDTIIDSQRQSEMDLAAAKGLLSRRSCPVFRRRLWRPMVFQQTDLTESSASFAYYGEGFKYGDDNLFYGQPVQRKVYSLPAPANLKQLVALCESPVATTVLLPGVDFQLNTSRQVIEFFLDPFANPAFTKVQITGADGLPSQTLRLWAWQADADQEMMWQYYGYAVRLRYPSSAAYKRLINATWDAHVNGPTESSFRQAVAAALGIELCATDGEVVEVVTRTQDSRLQIVTDSHVYTFSSSAKPCVVVGDTVYADDPLVAGIEFDATRGPGVLLDRDMLGSEYRSGLLFVNQLVPLTYSTDELGWADARFAVYGLPEDVATFWANLVAYGHRTGKTLARALDTRTGGNGEPQPQNLPAQVNPFELVMSLLRPSFKLVALDTGLTADGAPGLGALRSIRETLSPATSVRFVITLDFETEYATVAPDADAAGCVFENVLVFDAETVPLPMEGQPLFVAALQ